MVLFAATAAALLQPVHPDPFAPRGGLGWWQHPIETNARWRLPTVRAQLNDLAVQRGEHGEVLLQAVGDDGAIVHSDDGGKTSLMNLLRQDLADKHFRPVWFNAWHHQKGEQILAGLFAHIRGQSIPPVLSGRGLRFQWRLLTVSPLEISIQGARVNGIDCPRGCPLGRRIGPDRLPIPRRYLVAPNNHNPLRECAR